MSLIQSYSEINVDTDWPAEDFDPSASVQISRDGLAFITPALTVWQLTSFKLWLKKVGTPTGNARASLYAATGSIEAATPTGSELAGVDFDISTLTNSYALYEFIFAVPYTSAPSTTYCIYLRNPTTATIDTSNYPVMGLKDAGGNGINQIRFDQSGWIANSRSPAYYLYGNDLGSPSVSPSASRSPSSSVSASLSPSASISPSSSRSPSASISPSSSASLSPSSSRSPSISPSSSISASLSPSASVSFSPSEGFADYTRGDYVALPTDDTDLKTVYTLTEVEKTQVESNQIPDVENDINQAGILAYLVHQFKVFVANQSWVALEFSGESTLATSNYPAYLQIYNRNNHVWDTVASDNSTPANITFELKAKRIDIGNYANTSKVIACRVFQYNNTVNSVTFSVDLFRLLVPSMYQDSYSQQDTKFIRKYPPITNTNLK